MVSIEISFLAFPRRPLAEPLALLTSKAMIGSKNRRAKDLAN